MKKVYVVLEAVRQLMPEQKYEEIVDVNMIAVCANKRDAERIASQHNPFTTKIKESYIG